MMRNIVYRSDTSKQMMECIDGKLEKYNFSKNKWLNPCIYNDKKDFGMYAYIDEKMIGGAYAYIDDGYWLYLDLLFVDEEFRNQDIATNLINSIEQFAIDHKCVGIRTETWGFQAKEFYEKMGFELYGQLENHPPKAINYFFKKVLITDENDFPDPIQ